MDVNVDMIFRIAAIGIIVAVLNQVLTRAGARRSGYDDYSCRASRCSLSDNKHGERFFSDCKNGVYAVTVQRKEDT